MLHFLKRKSTDHVFLNTVFCYYGQQQLKLEIKGKDCTFYASNYIDILTFLSRFFFEGTK
jgi:hypothetical protein